MCRNVYIFIYMARCYPLFQASAGGLGSVPLWIRGDSCTPQPSLGSDPDAASAVTPANGLTRPRLTLLPPHHGKRTRMVPHRMIWGSASQ